MVNIDTFENEWDNKLKEFKKHIQNGIIENWDIDSDEDIEDFSGVEVISEEELGLIDIDSIEVGELPSFMGGRDGDI